MVKGVDVHVVDGQDAVSNVESPAALGGRTGDDPPDGGAGARDGRDYHKAKALVLAAGHGDVVGIGLWSAAIAI